MTPDKYREMATEVERKIADHLPFAVLQRLEYFDWNQIRDTLTTALETVARAEYARGHEDGVTCVKVAMWPSGAERKAAKIDAEGDDADTPGPWRAGHTCGWKDCEAFLRAQLRIKDAGPLVEALEDIQAGRRSSDKGRTPKLRALGALAKWRAE